VSAFVDAVRSSSRAGRYRRLRRQQSGSAGSDLRRALLVWGLPAAAPVLGLLAAALGREARLIEVSLALLALAALAHASGKPRLTAFDLLHQPSRRGLVLGHLLHRLPVLVWAGLMAGATWLVLMPWLPTLVGGSLVLGAVFLAPLALGVSAGAAKVSDHAGRGEAASILVFVLPFLGWEAAELWASVAPWKWWLVALGALAGLAIIIGTGTLLATLRKACALLLTVAVVALPVEPGEVFTTDSVQWITGGALAAAACLVVLLVGLRTQLAFVDLAEVIETRADAEDPEADATAARSVPAGPLRRERSGAGLWRGRLGYLRDEWLPAPGAGWNETVRTLTAVGLVAPFSILRGPLLAVAAVAAASEQGALLWLAVLAGCWAQRTAAVDGIDLEQRLWLLGVDYRDQVLHGLRSLVIFAALPTLGAALVTLAVIGPTDPGRQAAVVAIAATLLLRSGLPGLWPLQETHRLRLIGVWALVFLAIVATSVVMRDWRWPALDVLHVSGVAAGAGLLLLLARFLRLREPLLRDRVRRAGEP
jgi:hypothetical protein